MNPRSALVFIRRPGLRPNRILLAAFSCATALAGGCDGTPTAPLCRNDASAADGGGCADDASTEASDSAISEAGDARETGAPPDANGVLDASPDAAAGAAAEAATDSRPDADATACDPTKDPKDQPCVVDDAYGIFVSASAQDGAASTKADPVKTISDAIAKAVAAGKSRVYVCQGSYAEQVVLDAQHDGIGIYGGLDCLRDWTWTGGKVTVAGPSPLYALRVVGTTKPVDVEDVTFVVPDASGQDGSGAGNSSIAAFIHGGVVNLRRVVLAAGKGADAVAGADGISTPNYPALQPAAPGGQHYDDVTATVGGPGGVNQCVFGSSQGGAGGANGTLPGTSLSYPGHPGTASPLPPNATPPFDGAGGPSVSADGSHSYGNPGADGAGSSAGSMATSYGMLSAAGWTPSRGGDGQPGNPGQGGGGGAGFITPPLTLGGDGGGSGGCGGSGGKGGSGGGASIALASASASVTLTACTLTASDAGSGGAGGAGQSGQAGGPNTWANPAGAYGGTGGNGAGGAGGAGGTGGVSVGIAYQGTLPSSDAATFVAVGAGGRAGSGGAKGARGGNSGSDGQSGMPGRPGVSSPLLVQ
jgi:hypothetical protein